MDYDSEEWRVIPGYEKCYASSLGRVKQNEKIKSLTERPDGYRQVSLLKDGKNKLVLAHRLIAMAFIDNPEGNKLVVHISDDRHDDRPCNLKWISKKDAMYKSQYEKGRVRSFSVEDVVSIRERFFKGESQRSIAKSYGKRQGAISGIINGVSWKHLPNPNTRNIDPVTRATLPIGVPETPNEIEVWKTLDNYPYDDISNLGRVRNKRTMKVRIGYLTDGGYRIVTVKTANKEEKQILVHRLVAMAFLPRGEEDEVQVNHINMESADNRAVNLAWSTIANNAREARGYPRAG